MTLAERHKRDTGLVRRARRGDQAAKAEICMHYDKVAWKMALRYHSTWLTSDDLIQEARIGLLDAIERWDPRRGTQFLTVAAVWCRCRAQRAARGLLTSGALRAFARGGKAVYALHNQGDRDGALACWHGVSELTQLLFAEPSPAPAKYWLARCGLIDSAEVRLPMVEVSAKLAARLDAEFERRRPPLLRRA